MNSYKKRPAPTPRLSIKKTEPPPRLSIHKKGGTSCLPAHP
ncbi:MAG: hypothetical protein ACNYPD_08410 [Candidatus Halichondribacter symbioticus]